MNTSELLSAIDSEISLLQRARELLSGRVVGNSAPEDRPMKRQTMTAEARARIGAATKARWAAGKMGKQSRKRLKRLEAKQAA